MASLLFIEKVPSSIRAAFEEKILGIASRIYPDAPFVFANWMMAVMNSESGLDAQAVNWQSANKPGYDGTGKLVKRAGTPDGSPSERAVYRATGLIQFMPKTAAYLGTTTRALYGMNELQQLDWVEKYYRQWKGRYKTFVDLYLATFYPKFLGMPWETKFPENVTQYNTGIDLNKDGILTVGEFAEFAAKKLPKDLKETRPDIYRAFFFLTEKARKNPVVTVLTVSAFVGLMYYGIKKYG